MSHTGHKRAKIIYYNYKSSDLEINSQSSQKYIHELSYKNILNPF